jgi:hypothetical protein
MTKSDLSFAPTTYERPRRYLELSDANAISECGTRRSVNLFGFGRQQPNRQEPNSSSVKPEESGNGEIGHSGEY